MEDDEERQKRFEQPAPPPLLSPTATGSSTALINDPDYLLTLELTERHGGEGGEELGRDEMMQANREGFRQNTGQRVFVRLRRVPG